MIIYMNEVYIRCLGSLGEKYLYLVGCLGLFFGGREVVVEF